MSKGCFLAVQLPNEDLFGTEEAFKDELWRVIRKTLELYQRPLLHELSEVLGNEELVEGVGSPEWESRMDGVLTEIAAVAFGAEDGTQTYSQYGMPHIYCGDSDEDYVPDAFRWLHALEVFMYDAWDNGIAQNVDYDSLSEEEMRAYLKQYRLGEGVVEFVKQRALRQEP